MVSTVLLCCLHFCRPPSDLSFQIEAWKYVSFCFNSMHSPRSLTVSLVQTPMVCMGWRCSSAGECLINSHKSPGYDSKHQKKKFNGRLDYLCCQLKNYQIISSDCFQYSKSQPCSPAIPCVYHSVCIWCVWVYVHACPCVHIQRPEQDIRGLPPSLLYLLLSEVEAYHFSLAGWAVRIPFFHTPVMSYRSTSHV